MSGPSSLLRGWKGGWLPQERLTDGRSFLFIPLAPSVSLLHRRSGVNRFSLRSFIFKLLTVARRVNIPAPRSSQIQIFTRVYFSSANYSDEVFLLCLPSPNFIVLSPLADVLCFFSAFYLTV